MRILGGFVNLPFCQLQFRQQVFRQLLMIRQLAMLPNLVYNSLLMAPRQRMINLADIS